MAEALYRGPLLVRVDAFGLSIVGSTPGPAGVSAHTFADSTRWEVDHAQPHALGELSADDPTRALAGATIEHCIGSDRLPALQRIIRAPGPRPRRLASRDAPSSRDVDHRRRADGAWSAGRVLVLIDLAHAEELRPFGQLAAAIELAAESDQYDDRPMFVELAAAARRRAEFLTRELNPDDLDSLAEGDPSTARRLVGALTRVLWRADPASPSSLRDLDDGLRQAIAHAEAASTAGDTARDELAFEAMSEPAAAMREPHHLAAAPAVGYEDADVVDLETKHDERAKRRFTAAIVHGTRLQVILRDPVPFDRGWVRILRRDGLAMLAMVPVGNTGMPDRAEAPVPPRTDIATLVIEIVEHPVPARPPSWPDQLRQAILSGRRACRQERLGDPHATRRAWRDCAAMWLALGDAERAAAATRYGEAAIAGTRGDPPFIADYLAG